jgi:hypothetical protein
MNDKDLPFLIFGAVGLWIFYKITIANDAANAAVAASNAAGAAANANNPWLGVTSAIGAFGSISSNLSDLFDSSD